MRAFTNDHLDEAIMVQKSLREGQSLQYTRGMFSAKCHSLSQHSFVWSGQFSHIHIAIYIYIPSKSIIKEQGSSLQTDTGIRNCRQ